MSGLLHEWVAVAAAFDDAGFEAAGAVADSAGGDAGRTRGQVSLLRRTCCLAKL